MRFALKLAYDGRFFHGFARQPRLETVEGAVIKALMKHDIIEDTKSSNFRAASRTDKGVSSLGNVIAFNTDTQPDLSILNKELDHIFLYAVQEVNETFYPRHATQRIYRYYLYNDAIAADDLFSTLSLFTGTHNYSNYARLEEGKNPIRTIDTILVDFDKTFFIVDFYAQTFLWHQIRRIISAVQQACINKISQEEIVEALQKPDHSIDFGLAPAEPLILLDVLYGFSFEMKSKTVKRLKQIESQIVTNLHNQFL